MANRITRYIPDTVTLLNLLSGACACILAMWGQYFPAFLFILAAACFDFLDGWCARLLNAYSELGKQLDSLSDLISFGLAPALLFFNRYLNAGHHHTAFAYVALLLAAFAALRLAKFNIDKRQSVDFIGLPTPAMAMIVAPLCGYGQICSARATDSVVLTLLDSAWFIPTVSVVLALLMISEVPMFSMKHKKLSFKQFPRETIFSVCFVLIFLVVLPLGSIAKESGLGWFYSSLPLGMALSFSVYILINLVSIGLTTSQQSR